MENRLRNEKAFNELLEELQRRSTSYFESSLTNLKNHYINTNPFYLFSNQFHDLIARFSAQMQNDKKFDVRKCVKELIQELTFYKIVCPLKHMRLADSNIPSLVTALRSQSWPNGSNQTPTPANGSHDCEKDAKCNSEVKQNGQQIAWNGAVSNSSLNRKTSSEPLIVDREMLTLEDKRSVDTIEDALKSRPKDGSTTVINLNICKQTEIRLVDKRSTVSVVSESSSRDSNAKRKVGEIERLKEDEISRKKTSNGQSLVRIRKQQLNKFDPDVESSNRHGETIYIIDDEDDDVIIKSCIIQPNNKVDINRDVTNVVTKEKMNEPSKVLVQDEQVEEVRRIKLVPNDDVFIVDGNSPLRNDTTSNGRKDLVDSDNNGRKMLVVPQRRDFNIPSGDFPPGRKPHSTPFQVSRQDLTDDIIVVDGHQPRSNRRQFARPNLFSDTLEDNDVCIVSYSRYC